jgi:hypothetical protein
MFGAQEMSRVMSRVRARRRFIVFREKKNLSSFIFRFRKEERGKKANLDELNPSPRQWSGRW